MVAARAGDVSMTWFFAVLIVLALGGVAAGGRRARRPDGRRRTTTGPTRCVPADGDAQSATTCAGSASPRRSAATGCPRSTRCSSGWPPSSRNARRDAAEPGTTDGALTMARNRASRAHSAACPPNVDRLHPDRAGRRRGGPHPAPAGRRQSGCRTVPDRQRPCSTCTRSSGVARPDRPGSVFLVSGAGSPGRQLRSSASSRLALWWVDRVAGLPILVRWLPSAGKHSSAASTDDTWSEGPGPLGPRPRRACWSASACSPGPTSPRRSDATCCSRSRAAPGRAAGARRRLPRRPRPRRPTPPVLRARRSATAVVEKRVIGALGARPADHGLAPRRARQAARSCSSRPCTATSAHTRADPAPPCATAADDPRHRPVGGPDVQPRRPRPPAPASNAHGVDLNRNYPYRLGRPRRQLRVRAAAAAPSPRPGR